MRISDWISDVCSSDLHGHRRLVNHDAVAFHMLGNGLSYGKHLLQVGGAVFIGRRTYRNELHFAVLHTQNRVDRKVEATRSVIFLHQATKPRLENWNLTIDWKSTRLNSSHYCAYRMPSTA